MRNVAINVREAVVPGAGHWLMEENPTITIGMIRDFLKAEIPTAAAPLR
jgi:pimeloyl-ACP methyl ester carboxylesterase